MNTSTSLSVFTFAPGMDLRVVIRDGCPWFIAADVCSALGLQNPAQAVGELDPTDKHIQSIGLKGRAPWLVSESGLYALIFKSRKPVARDFQRWVTSVVLPAIRKDGAYVMGEEKVATGEMSEDELIAKGFMALHAKAERLQAEVLKLNQTVAEQAPMARAGELMCADEEGLHNFIRSLTGINMARYRADLESLGYLYRPHGLAAYRPYRGKNELREGWSSRSPQAVEVHTRRPAASPLQAHGAAFRTAQGGGCLSMDRRPGGPLVALVRVE